MRPKPFLTGLVGSKKIRKACTTGKSNGKTGHIKTLGVTLSEMETPCRQQTQE
jgi:hypothetical protein